MKKIAEYYAVYFPDKTFEDFAEPSEVEKEVFGAFNIEITQPIDWLINGFPAPNTYPHKLSNIVDNYLLFAHRMYPNFNGPKPFDTLISQLGGQFLSQRYILQITAPTVEAAVSIEQSLHVAEKELVPWIVYYGGQRVPNASEFWQQCQICFATSPLREQLLDTVRTLGKQQNEIWRKRAQVKREDPQNTQQLAALTDQFDSINQEIRDLEERIYPLGTQESFRIYGMNRSIHLYRFNVSRTERTITLEAEGLGDPVMGPPSLVAWLRAQECDVEIEFLPKVEWEG